MKLMLVSLFVLCVGCSSPETVARSSSSDNGAWSVTVTYSGGIAGITRKTVIRHDGLILQEKSKRHSVSSRASKKKLFELSSAVKRLSAKAGEKSESSSAYKRFSQCRDCMYTTIEVSSDGRKIYQSNFVSGKPSDSQAAELLELVQNILKQQKTN